jgi:hypothetical protein
MQDQGEVTDPTSSSRTLPLPLGLSTVLLAIIIVGLGLRLVCPADSAFFVDQAEACAFAEDIVHGHFPAAGLFNSSCFRNLPGFPYVVAGIWWLRPDPLAVVVAFRVLNVAAVVATGLLLRA